MIKGSIRVTHPDFDKLLKKKGLDKDGDVQQEWTKIVLNHIIAYMPYRTGATIKLTRLQSPVTIPRIKLDAPYARYLWEGKVMVDSVTGSGPRVIPGVGPRWRRGATLRATDRPLTYTTSKNPKAGPHWGERLKAERLDQMGVELKEYVRRREGRE